MVHFPLIIIGAGPAGIAAAAEAGAAGIRALLVDERPAPGGAVSGPLPAVGSGDAGWYLPPVLYPERAALLRDWTEACRAAGVQILTDAFAWGLFRRNCWLVPVLHGGRTHVYTADRLILATGCWVAPDPQYDLNDPGLLTTADFFHRIQDGRMLGAAIAVHGEGELAERLARLAEGAGARARVIPPSEPASLRPEAPPAPERAWRDDLASRNGRRPSGIDYLVVAAPVLPAYELAMLAGCQLVFDAALGGYRPRVNDHMETSVTGVFAAGGLAGIIDFEAAVASGRIAACGVAASLGRTDPDRQRWQTALRGLLPGRTASGTMGSGDGDDRGAWAWAGFTAALAGWPDDFVLCPCTGVTKGAAVASARAGCQAVDDLKRQCGIGTGACQGRRCGRAALKILELESNHQGAGDGFSPERAGPMRVRAPIRPVPLGQLSITDGGAGKRDGQAV